MTPALGRSGIAASQVMMNCDVVDLGLIDYDAGRSLQETCAAEIARGDRPPTMLLLEHPHVYTFGTGGSAENLLWSEEELAARRISVRWVDRGGDVTYHGPGQLVGYPLIPLGQLTSSTAAVESDAGGMRIARADYLGYVRRLEKMLIAALARLGVAGAQIPRFTGVWVQPDVHSRCARCRPEDRRKPAKIASIGVRVDAHGISRHGFALNVNPDMSYWDGIVACGLAAHPVASIADLLQVPPALDKVKRCVASAFAETFDCKIQWLPPGAALPDGVRPLSSAALN